MNKGFTLIELLVVIAIIVLIVSVVLPSFAAARDRGRQTVCAVNLRTVVLGVRMYAEENKQWLPTAEPPEREFPDCRHWFMNIGLLKQINTPCRGAKDDALVGPPQGGTVLICPTHENPSHWRDGTTLQYGLSYGMNGTWGLGGRPDHIRQRRMVEFKNESDVMAFMDAGGIEAAPGIVLYKSCPKDNIEFRHRGKANVVFLDGHVAVRTHENIPFGMENRDRPFWSSQKP